MLWRGRESGPQEASQSPALLSFIASFVSLSPNLADGVALGAAASTSQTSVQLIVFVAIMLHKVSQDWVLNIFVIKICLGL